MANKDQFEKFRKMLWPKIEDASTAMEASKLAQWVGVLIAIGYGLALVLAISTDQYPDGTPAEDEAELYGMAFFSVVLLLLALLFWFLARQGKGWAVLILSVWGLIEAVVKLVTLPGQGVILTILIILFCISGIRGWFGVRKFGQPGVPPDETAVSE